MKVTCPSSSREARVQDCANSTKTTGKHTSPTEPKSTANGAVNGTTHKPVDTSSGNAAAAVQKKEKKNAKG